MANGPDLASFGAFKAPAESALGALKERRVRERGILAQNLATRGVRSSGVSVIPGQEFRRATRAGERDILTKFGLAKAGADVTDRRIAQERAFRIKQGELNRAMQARSGRSQLFGQIIGGGLAGLGAGAF